MHTRLTNIIIAFLMFYSTIFASTGIGKYAGEFLAIGIGGRALGLGGAYSAIANDVTSIYWNPAGLSQLNYPQLSLMHTEQFGGIINYDFAGVGLPVGSNTSIGVGFIRLGIDGIADTRDALVDENGNGVFDENERLDKDKISYFNAVDWGMYFTYSKKSSDRLSYGINIKLISRDLNVGNAIGIGFDIGVQFNPYHNFFVGLNLQDATTTLVAWNNGTKELISPTLKIGTAYSIDALGGKFIPVLDFDIRFENRQYASNFNLGTISFDMHTGLEFDYRNIVALRAGYSEIGTTNMGVGIHLPKLDIDYTFATSKLTDSRFDDTHRVSITFTFETEKLARKIE